jgi:hypothetical protein
MNHADIAHQGRKSRDVATVYISTSPEQEGRKGHIVGEDWPVQKIGILVTSRIVNSRTRSKKNCGGLNIAPPRAAHGFAKRRIVVCGLEVRISSMVQQLPDDDFAFRKTSLPRRGNEGGHAVHVDRHRRASAKQESNDLIITG